VTSRRLRKPVPGGEKLFQRIYTRLGCEGRPPAFVVEFHPYTDFTHTIRLRKDTAYVRLSDALDDAPNTVVEAAAAILLGKLYRRKPPKDLLHAYREFSYAGTTRSRLLTQRQSRARRTEHRPAGTHHDLEAMFRTLNQQYFENSLAQPIIGWSKRAWRGLLGCFDPALQQIVINKQLDRQTVPRFVVEYVMYHEMLHVRHPMKFERCRRKSHSSEFRREEKKYTEYTRAMKFLDHFSTR